MTICIRYEMFRADVQRWEWFFAGAYDKLPKAMKVVEQLVKDAAKDPSLIREIDVDILRDR